MSVLPTETPAPPSSEAAAAVALTSPGRPDVQPYPLSHVDRNILWNLLGRCWSALLAISLVPVYTSFVGIEAYGLIGFFSVTLALSNLFDLGLTATINRELAQRTASHPSDSETRDLTRSLEIPYWLIGLAMSAVLIAASSWLAGHWLRPVALGRETLRLSLVLMALALSFYWPMTFYSGALFGLHQLKKWNAAWVLGTTVRGGGAVLVLWLVSPTVPAFFAWHIVAFAVHTLTLRWLVWRQLGSSSGARWRADLFRSVWHFAGPMTLVAGLGLIITQFDKILLSRLLPLSVFGYYSLAAVLATGLYTLIMPVFDATFPQFSKLSALGDSDGLRRLYLRTSQILALLLVPFALVTCFCSNEIVYVWTKNPAAVAATSQILTLLVIGTTINGLISVPYALQLAKGWMSITIWTNVAALLFGAPFMILLTRQYGAVGAAFVWPAINLFFFLVSPAVMHWRLLPEARAAWYRLAVFYPVAAGIPVAFLGSRLVQSAARSRFVLAAALLGLYFATLLAAAAATPVGRNQLAGIFRLLRGRSTVPAAAPAREGNP